MAQLVLLDHLVFLGYPVYLEYLEYLDQQRITKKQGDVRVLMPSRK